jgi:serine/threonine protein kinase
MIAGKYLLGEVIGIGGMGVVLAGEHAELQQPVAVKLLLPRVALYPGARDRFVREAHAAARIRASTRCASSTSAPPNTARSLRPCDRAFARDECRSASECAAGRRPAGSRLSSTSPELVAPALTRVQSHDRRAPIA